jgi:TPR repeat protein
MGTLGIRLLDGEGMSKDEATGRGWLEKAANDGDARAMRTLGTRLLDGEGVSKDEVVGRAWLEKAAKDGDSSAMLELADRFYIGSIGIPRDPEISSEWLERAAIAPDVNLAWLGLLYFQQGHHHKAAYVFKRAFDANDSHAGNNLAYLLRRGETPPDLSVPSVSELLAPGLKEEFNFAKLNHSLCLARGFQNAIDWQTADRIVQTIASPDELVEWWHPLAQSGDGEGHLVLGWLARHGLISDPNAWTVTRRLEAARESGWDVPDWMLQAPPNTS